MRTLIKCLLIQRRRHTCNFKAIEEPILTWKSLSRVLCKPPSNNGFKSIRSIHSCYCLHLNSNVLVEWKCFEFKPYKNDFSFCFLTTDYCERTTRKPTDKHMTVTLDLALCTLQKYSDVLILTILFLTDDFQDYSSRNKTSHNCEWPWIKIFADLIWDFQTSAVPDRFLVNWSPT